jgi:hypothetical protein
MLTAMRFRTLLSSVGLLLPLGCGEDDGMGRRYSARGTVTYRDQPVPKGTVAFVPVNDRTGRVASGELSEDGSFGLTTHVRGDGALAGHYRVTVIAQDADRSKIQRVGPGMPLLDRKHKVTAKELVPRRYSSPTSTPLLEEVKPQTNNFHFKLVD